MLVHEKDGSWRMCFDCQAFNNFLIHEEVRFNIGQRAEKYEKQASEGYQRLVFDPGGWILLHMIKERCSQLHTRIDGPSKIIKKIGKNAYKLELHDDNNILYTFNVKDLRPYHGEDLRASLFSQLWGIDAGASTTNIENSINVYKLELPDDNNILPTFNVKDLRSYHGKDLRGKSFFPTMGD